MHTHSNSNHGVNSRKRISDDNVSWLITFADLMTILLVFSFITYTARTEVIAEMPKPKTEIHPPASFTSLAYANTDVKHKKSVSLPVYIPEQRHKSTKAENRDTLVLRKILTFYTDSPSLKDHHKRCIGDIVKLAQKNESTRIIVAADVGDRHSTGMCHVNDVCGYLRHECDIPKKRIYIQSLPHIPAPMSASGHQGIKKRQSVEISLIKPFWCL